MKRKAFLIVAVAFFLIVVGWNAYPGGLRRRPPERLMHDFNDALMHEMESAAYMCSPMAYWGKGPRQAYVIQRDLVRLEICRRGATLARTSARSMRVLMSDSTNCAYLIGEFLEKEVRKTVCDSRSFVPDFGDNFLVYQGYVDEARIFQHLRRPSRTRYGHDESRVCPDFLCMLQRDSDLVRPKALDAKTESARETRS
jgi:hypothetical protein